MAALDTPPSPTQPSHSHCQNQRFGSRQSPRKMPTSWKCTQGHLDRNRKTQLCLGGHFLGPLDSSPRVESHSQRVTEQCLIKQEPHSRDASGPEIISNCNWHSPRYSLFFFGLCWVFDAACRLLLLQCAGSRHFCSVASLWGSGVQAQYLSLELSCPVACGIFLY